MYDNQELIKALEHINPAQLSYKEWLDTGMALKSEGLDVSVWDSWSQKDTDRYESGECEKKWSTFDPAKAGGVTGGTIFHVAKERFGYVREGDAGQALDWNDTAQAVEPKPALAPSSSTAAAAVDRIKLPTFERLPNPTALDPLDLDPAEQLQEYVRNLFLPGERINVVAETFATKDGKALPYGFGKTYTPDELYHSAETVLEGSNPRTGAWVRFNPVTSREERDAKTDEQEIAYTEGKTKKEPNKAFADDDVTAWRYALVESDDLPQDEQLDMILRLHLPCAAIVDSGGKSVHAIIRVDASDAKQHAERTRALYGYCNRNGLTVDTSCRNPSRLSRLPGAMRGGRIQKLVGVSVGPRSWGEFVRVAQELAWDEPKSEHKQLNIISAADITGENTPPMTPSLISGIVRRGHKLIITSESKAGKTWLLDGMAMSLATGRKWLDRYRCKKSRVLLVNTEIDAASHANRLEWIRQTWGLAPADYRDTLMTVSLRGERWSIEEFVEEIIGMSDDGGFDAVLLDSIYKLFQGNENDNTEVSQKLFAHLDKLCNTDTMVAFVHHNAKGSGARAAIDKASGAGMFARDPDGIITISICKTTEEQEEYLRHWNYHRGEDYIEAQAQRIDLNQREFGGRKKSLPPLIFRCPVHFFDETGELEKVRVAGSPEDNGAEGGIAKAAKSRTEIQKTDKRLAEMYNELTARGENPTYETVLDPLNEWRKRNGMRTWQLKTFQNHLSAKTGDLSFVTGKNKEIVPREQSDATQDGNESGLTIV